MAVKTMRASLSKIPFLTIEQIKKEPDSGAGKPDFLVKLALPEGERYLVVEVKTSGQPRLAREAVNQLVRYRDVYPNAYAVFMAPYISPRAAEICKKEDIGYIDLAGNCRLSFGQVYIEQEGNPNPLGEKRDLRSLYSPKAERVLRVLLNNEKRAWKMAELADEAKISLGQVSNVKKLLLDREWIQTDKRGLVLSEPEQLLREWSENYSFKKSTVRDYYSLGRVGEIESDLAESCRREGYKYALTAFSAAAMVAPAVRYQRAMAYMAEIQEDLMSELGLKRVTTGANLSLVIPYDEGVFYGVREIDGIRMASPIQVYLDLRGFRGRGEEAAQVLLDQVIRSSW
ncbi:MAG: hypothetical protein JRJ47_12715 [Deltaproteobacteria bacterium]|nr:hypothetical protein [Deltaproteobacteria bacterium]